MVVPIIDISDLIDINILSENEVQKLTRGAVDEVGRAVYNKIRESVRELNSTRAEYESGIGYYSTTDGMGVVISLSGKLALMIEDGCSAFDMKQGFANSSKAKRTGENLKAFNKGNKMKYDSAGWYLTIPFRIGTPGTVAENFSGSMDEPIYKVAKGLQSKIVTSSNETFLSGGSISKADLQKIDSDLGTKYAERKKRQPIEGFGDYQHVSPLMQGMIKVTKQYEKAMQNTYMTFRRVSSKSDANSWIHRGFTAKKYFDNAMGSIDFKGIVEQYISSQVIE